MKIVAGVPEPGKAVVGPADIVGIVLAPGQMGGGTGEGFILDGHPVMTAGDVYVRPVTDVVKGQEAVALPSGDLAMRQPGELPEGAVLIQDCRWGSDAVAGELALLHCGIAIRAAMEAARERAMLAEEDDDESLPDWHPV